MALFYQAIRNLNTLRNKLLSVLLGATGKQYHGGNPEMLSEKLGAYDMVSFDVFDTLVCRPYDKPTDLFVDMEKKNHISGFHDIRIRAEADARTNSAKPNREIDIFDIYEVLARQLGLDAHELAEQEITAEKRCCYPNPDIMKVCHLLHKRDTRIVAISDMYLPEHTVRVLLEGCGYNMFDAVYVSCSCGVGKRCGGLFRLVRATEGKPTRCIHVGDNLRADVLGARRAGWDAVWYQKTKER